MRAGRLLAAWMMLSVVLLAAGPLLAAPDDVTFPAPIRSGGRGLFTVLQGRAQTERFEPRLMHWEVIGNLLWAGCGVNRPDQGGRTVPVLGPSFAVQLYLLAAEGVWYYEPLTHRLVGSHSGDFRELATTPILLREGALGAHVAVPSAADEPVPAAPVVLLFVAVAAPRGEARLAAAEAGNQGRALVKAALQAGHIAQNIQLFGASEGIGIKTHIKPAQAERLARQLDLASPEQILMAQSLGYPVPR